MHLSSSHNWFLADESDLVGFKTSEHGRLYKALLFGEKLAEKASSDRLVEESSRNFLVGLVEPSSRIQSLL